MTQAVATDVKTDQAQPQAKAQEAARKAAVDMANIGVAKLAAKILGTPVDPTTAEAGAKIPAAAAPGADAGTKPTPAPGEQPTTWTAREQAAMRQQGLDPADLDPASELHRKFVEKAVVKHHSALGERYSKLGHAEADLKRREAELAARAPAAAPGNGDGQGAEAGDDFDPELYGERELKLLRAAQSVVREREAEKADAGRRQAEQYQTDFRDKASVVLAGLDPNLFAEIGGGVAQGEIIDGGPQDQLRREIIEAAMDRVVGLYMATNGERQLSPDDAVREELVRRYPTHAAVIFAPGQPGSKARPKPNIPSIMRPTNSSPLPETDRRKLAAQAASDFFASRGVRIPP